MTVYVDDFRVSKRPAVLMEHGSVHSQLSYRGRNVAEAWSDSAVGAGEWWVRKGTNKPYRVEGRWAAELILGDLREDYDRMEASLYLPEHGPLGETGRIGKAPGGVLCVGCGTDLSGGSFVGTVLTTVQDLTSTHYICDSCECYLDDEGDDDA
jgi:hypothetical protein